MANTEVVTDAECQCCGMWEECTLDYIKFVEARFSGVWVCGLCEEAVKDEQVRLGLGIEAALRVHAKFREIISTVQPTDIAHSLRLLKKMISTSTNSPKS